MGIPKYILKAYPRIRKLHETKAFYILEFTNGGVEVMDKKALEGIMKKGKQAAEAAKNITYWKPEKAGDSMILKISGQEIDKFNRNRYRGYSIEGEQIVLPSHTTLSGAIEQRDLVGHWVYLEYEGEKESKDGRMYESWIVGSYQPEDEVLLNTELATNLSQDRIPF